jgi:cytochrome c oxidase subunit II
MSIIISIGFILVLVILGLLFRTQGLVDVLRGSAEKRVGLSNQINAALFPVFLVLGLAGFIWLTVSSEKYYLPEAASIHGKITDAMFWQSVIIITIVFVGTHILLFTFPFIYQYKEGRKATFFADNDRLELVWTVIPAIVLALLVISGYKEWTKITDPVPTDHAELEIVGKQFNWIVRYPGKDGKLGKHNFRKIDATNDLGMDFEDKATFDDFKVGEIHIPKDKPVLFHIRSRDVLHSVFAMHFRQKMDAVPGMPTQFWFTPTKTTAEMRAETGNSGFNYEIACTEVCGRNHFAMRMVIVVDEPADYEKWYTEQKSFLSQNPEYLAQVPESLKSLASAQISGPSVVDAGVTVAPKAASVDSTSIKEIKQKAGI